MKIPAIFFCGDRSPYGLAHLEAIAKLFDLKGLVIADELRWVKFRYALTGGETYKFLTPLDYGLHRFKKVIQWPFVTVQEAAHQWHLKKLGIPVFVVHDVNSSSAFNLIQSLSPQVLISAAYPQIFKKPLLDIAPRGAINFHPSLLPRCRGAHPHYWSLATGERLGGLSAHFMTEQIDDGDIIAQRSFDLEGFYYEDLYKKIIEETPLLVAAVADFLKNEQSKAIPQNEELATIFRNEREIHRRLDFIQMSGKQLHDRVRAGRAYSIFRGKRIQISRMQIAGSNRHEVNDILVSPGVITDMDETGIWVATNDRQFVIINELIGPKKILDFRKWVSKMGVQVGEKFE
jgi:methionyl-tRNA formyltransferase